MNKQEIIRKGIEAYTDYPAALLQYLHQQGVVIIDRDKELPESPDTDYIIAQYKGECATAEDVALMHLNGIEKGKRLMLNAGYHATMPLVEE